MAGIGGPPEIIGPIGEIRDKDIQKLDAELKEIEDKDNTKKFERDRYTIILQEIMRRNAAQREKTLVWLTVFIGILTLINVIIVFLSNWASIKSYFY